MATKDDSFIKKLINIAPLLISCILLAAQWGSITTKITLFEDNLKTMFETVQETDRQQSIAIDKTNDSLNKLQVDLAYISGKLKADSE